MNDLILFLDLIEKRSNLLKDYKSNPIGYDPCGDAQKSRDKDLTDLENEIEFNFRFAIKKALSDIKNF